jgi:ferredoxin
MAIRISDDCINCGACRDVCPNGALYANGTGWRFSDKTALKGIISSKSGMLVDADKFNAPKSYDNYYVVADKCTECVGFHDTPQCASVCPMSCCIPDSKHTESREELILKQIALH